MAHNVESMAYYGSKPWHGLGVEVLQLMTAEECLQKAGLDWTVEKQPIYLADGTRIPDQFATVRSKDGSPLGVVGKIYEPVQNVDALNFMDALTESGAAKYETAGSLQRGKLIWVMAQVPNGGGVDPIEQYLLATTSHDGTTPVMVTATPVRVVCNNTLNAAIKGAKNKFRIRHTTNWADKLAEAKRTLAGSLEYFHKANDLFAKLKEVKANDEFLEALVLKTFYGDVEMDDLSERQEKNYGELAEAIFKLSRIGKGTDLPGVKGTAWGAYNAVVEYLDHSSEVKGKKEEDGLKAIQSSVWFGTIADKNQVALDTTLALADLVAA